MASAKQSILSVNVCQRKKYCHISHYYYDKYGVLQCLYINNIRKCFSCKGEWVQASCVNHHRQSRDSTLLTDGDPLTPDWSVTTVRDIYSSVNIVWTTGHREVVI